MTHLMKISCVILFLLLNVCIISVVLAEELSGDIVIDDDGIVIESITLNTKIDGNDEISTITQSISVGSIVNSTSNGVSSIQIGTVDVSVESSCDQIAYSESQSNATKILGSNRNISLNSRVTPSVCIDGSQNKIVIQNNASVGKLYLHGSDNEIYISDAATVKRIEIVGQRNILTVPKEHNIVLKGLKDSYRLKVR